MKRHTEYYICDDTGFVYSQNIESKRQADKLCRKWRKEFPLAPNIEIKVIDLV